jgi:FkbM family methyltransferase
MAKRSNADPWIIGIFPFFARTDDVGIACIHDKMSNCFPCELSAVRKPMKSIFRSLCRFLARMLPTGMVMPVLKGPLRGKTWIVGAAAGEGKGLSIIINQSEPEQLRYAVKMLNKNSICFDIGANVGLYTLLFSLYGKEVYAFEPLPRNLMYLERMIEINSLSNATIIPCAVCDVSGIGYFAEGKHASAGQLSPKGEKAILTTTCDQFILETGIVPQVIKIDVEGSELSVLKGALRLLESSHPSILLSTHSPRLRQDCLTYLKEIGYTVFLPLDSQDFKGASEFAVHYWPPP